MFVQAQVSAFALHTQVVSVRAFIYKKFCSTFNIALTAIVSEKLSLSPKKRNFCLLLNFTINNRLMTLYLMIIIQILEAAVNVHIMQDVKMVDLMSKYIRKVDHLPLALFWQWLTSSTLISLDQKQSMFSCYRNVLL